MKLSYSLIRKIHRLEKQSINLVKLDGDFFESLKLFLEEEKSKLQERDVFDDESNQKAFNLKNMLENILALRQKKIINKAILYVQTGEENKENMLLPEQKIYKKLINIFEEYQQYIKYLYNDKKESKNLDLKKIVILSDVPKFIGTDMKEYGPFKTEDVVEIPESIANIFINKGIAKEKVE